MRNCEFGKKCILFSHLYNYEGGDMNDGSAHHNVSHMTPFNPPH